MKLALLYSPRRQKNELVEGEIVGFSEIFKCWVVGVEEDGVEVAGKQLRGSKFIMFPSLFVCAMPAGPITACDYQGTHGRGFPRAHTLWGDFTRVLLDRCRAMAHLSVVDRCRARRILASENYIQKPCTQI
jgi:hypothetical protein